MFYNMFVAGAAPQTPLQLSPRPSSWRKKAYFKGREGGQKGRSSIQIYHYNTVQAMTDQLLYTACCTYTACLTTNQQQISKWSSSLYVLIMLQNQTPLYDDDLSIRSPFLALSLSVKLVMMLLRRTIYITLLQVTDSTSTPTERTSTPTDRSVDCLRMRNNSVKSSAKVSTR